MNNRSELMIRISKIGFILLTSLAYECNCNSCPATTPTLQIVDGCPTTEQEWNAASARKKCDSLSDFKGCGKTLVYHCLLNQWGNETLEVCAPPWFVSGFCTMFNTIEQRVIDNFNIDCTKFSNGSCPTRYESDKAYKYQKCYEKYYTNALSQVDKKFDKIKMIDPNNDFIIPLVILSIAVLVLSVLFVLALTGKIGRGECRRNSSDNTESVGTPEERRQLIIENRNNQPMELENERNDVPNTSQMMPPEQESTAVQREGASGMRKEHPSKSVKGNTSSTNGANKQNHKDPEYEHKPVADRVRSYEERNPESNAHDKMKKHPSKIGEKMENTEKKNSCRQNTTYDGENGLNGSKGDKNVTGNQGKDTEEAIQLVPGQQEKPAIDGQILELDRSADSNNHESKVPSTAYNLGDMQQENKEEADEANVQEEEIHLGNTKSTTENSQPHPYPYNAVIEEEKRQQDEDKVDEIKSPETRENTTDYTMDISKNTSVEHFSSND